MQENGEIFVGAAGRRRTSSSPSSRRGSPQASQPGQFVAVAVGGENTAMLLRRAFALYGATPGGEFAGTIQFVVAEHGPGTRWLVAAARRRRRSTSSARSARRSRCRPAPSPAVLVGGGYGTAPLIPLAAGAARERVAGRDRHRRGDRRPAVRRARRQARWSARSPSPPTTARPGRAAWSPTCCPTRSSGSAPRSSTRAGRCRCCARSATSRARTPSAPRSRSRSRWPAASACA